METLKLKMHASSVNTARFPAHTFREREEREITVLNKREIGRGAIEIAQLTLTLQGFRRTISDRKVESI